MFCVSGTPNLFSVRHHDTSNTSYFFYSRGYANELIFVFFCLSGVLVLIAVLCEDNF